MVVFYDGVLKVIEIPDSYFVVITVNRLLGKGVTSEEGRVVSLLYLLLHSLLRRLWSRTGKGVFSPCL